MFMTALSVERKRKNVKVGDRVVWIYNPHPDFQKIFTVKRVQYTEMIIPTIFYIEVNENNKKYSGIYMILESVYNSKLYRILA